MGDARTGRAGAPARARHSDVRSPDDADPVRAECARHALGRQPGAGSRIPSDARTPPDTGRCGPFQEDWNAEISQKKEAPREQEDDKKRRRLWGWGKRHKKHNEATVSPEPEIDEPIDSSHAPMISVDAQDEDDWNDWQNWNSHS